ncbi:MAG: peptidase inhibitor I78 [Roseomonas sp.]|nr:peptidase inhibitor I78 [Roseomonas sp.]MCA3307010.1 peptidase inhibitor I78 [Roseomonas sp.]
MTRKLRSLALTVGLLTMACAEVAPAQTQASPAPEGCAQHQARFAGLLGKAPDEVRAALQAMPGISTVRMGGPTTPMTKDYRIDRATGLIENGVVTQITCG